jgi:Leucine-rich repeat (LRR) protein
LVIGNSHNFEEIQRSLFNSSRKIKSVTINGFFALDKYTPDQLEKVLGHIGRNIVEFEYLHPTKDVGVPQVFNFMPNIEVLKLYGVNYENVDQHSILNLPNLRKLSIKGCSFEAIKIFNQLNDNILDELSLMWIDDLEICRCYFKNQRKLKKIHIILRHLHNFDFKKTKLEHVSLKKLDRHTLKRLKGQDKITHATFRQHIYSSDQNLSRLKSLEVLHVHVSYSNAEIDLSSNLNIRRVIIGSGFPSVKSEILQELMIEVDGINKESVEKLAANSPNLRVLKVRYINIDSVFLWFPKLESLCCNTVTKFSQVSDHEYLKHLKVQKSDRFILDADNIVAIVKRCPNLQSLEFLWEASKETVEKLLLAAPRLKSLSLRGHTKDYEEVIKNYGGRLDHFHCLLEESTNAKFDKQELEDQFDDFIEEKKRIEASMKEIAEKSLCYSRMK